MKIINLWNVKAKLYQRFRNRCFFGYILRKENRALGSLLMTIPVEYEVVFDLGTGTGNALSLIDVDTIRVGVDKNFLMLHEADRLIDAHFVNCDIEHLSFKSHSADLILTIGVLEYFSRLDSIFREIYRVAQTTAVIIISYAPFNVWSLLRFLLGHRIYPKTKKQITKIINRNGFCTIQTKRLIMQHQILLKKMNDGTSSF